MRNSRPVMGILGTLILSFCLSTSSFSQGSGAPVALVGATVYTSPAVAPMRDATVLVQDGKIVSVGSRRSTRVPKEAQILDCSGFTITAGFWNSHVHFLQRKWSDAATLPGSELDRQLQDMLTRYGFTSVFDTWSMWENTRRLRDRIESGEVPGPKIYSTGEATFPKGSAATQPGTQAITLATWGALGFMPLDKMQIARVDEPADAAAAARQLLDAGTDGVKLYAVTVGRNGLTLPDRPFRPWSRKPMAEVNPSSLTRPPTRD
jgi:hypothetical protein